MTEYLKLKPYKSLLLANIPPGIDTTGLIESVLNETETILGFSDQKKRFLVEKSDVFYDAPLEGGYIHYRVDSSPSWSSDPDIMDQDNHLFLIARYNQDIVIYLSESNRKRSLQALFDQGKTVGYGALVPVSQYKLNNAYVTGNTRTLWLSGTHRRTTIKPDSKILAGLNLRDALDPLEDQTYYFTAARSIAMLEGKATPVGCAPRASRIWCSTSSSWTDFRDGVVKLLNLMDDAGTGQDPPLPVVAYPVTANITNLNKPFEIAFMPPDAEDPNIEQVTLEEIELWGYHSIFDHLSSSNDGKHIEADILLNDVLLGRMSFDVSIDDNGRVVLEAGGQPESPATDADFQRAIRHAGRDQWVKIWYESGLTVTGGEIYSVRYRDYPFTNYRWLDFTDFNIGKEKPDGFPGNVNSFDDEIAAFSAMMSNPGHTSEQYEKACPSLFGWVYQYWPNLDRSHSIPRGWLTCDDGAGEIADFIHLGEEDGLKVLSLIHVKATKTAGISVADYEIVGSQAVKNLRWLDDQVLRPGLNRNILGSVGKFTWHDTDFLKKRNEMLDELDQLGTNYKRRVVIFQPSLAKSQANTARQRTNSSDHARLLQLDTLLLGIEADCHALNAELWVVGNNR